MSAMEDKEQGKVWSILYDRITKLLQQFGTENPFGEGDYWVLDDNWGPLQHKICVFNLKMLKPNIVYALQSLLSDFPDWGIVIAVDIPGKEKRWPPMGLTLGAHEIIDELQRQYFPNEFQNIEYEGSTRGRG